MMKSVLPWLEGLNLSACYFDGEHHVLLEKFNALINAISTKDQRLVLEATSALREVAKAHFENEERQMRENQYRSMSQHCASHRELLQRLADFHQEVSLMEDVSRLPQASLFLEQWLVPHLENDDKLFSTFLAARRYSEKASLP